MALPSAITYKMGVRTTADATSVSIDPKQPFIIGDQIYRHNPNKHQLLAWVMRNKRYRATTTSKFGHLEKAPLPNWVTYNGSDESSQGVTGLSFANGGTRLTTAFRIWSSRTGEIIRLNADMTANATGAVTRNFGTSGTPLIKKGDKFLIMPPAHAEGRTMGEGQTAGEVWQYFRTSIVDWPVQMTGTKAAEKFTDGDPFTNALNDAWEASEGQLEAEMLFGARVEDNSTYAYPMHTATGLLSWITTNVYTLPGYLTRMDLWDMIAEWCKFNKEGGALATSGEVIQLVNTWAFSKVQYNQELSKDGINIHQVQTPKGLFDLVEVDLFGQDPYLMGTIVFLPKVADKQGIDFRPLIGNENRDIAYIPVDRQEVDLKEGTIFGEYGWEYWGEERFAVATGIEF